ncbi:MAG: glycosyltransferase family 2 protein [Planctomycetaceae bacterium]|nr:glycosyltransferase family 2 protein [Planctomycetaceae bacterium]
MSVVLPVHNAETTLTHNVYELLDVLPEIASRFEVLIVDDGSTDHTEEIAHELARCYPQVCTVRHTRRRGANAAIQTGMAHTTGDIVFVHDEATPISASELRNLWSLRNDCRLVVARTEMPCRSPGPHVRERQAAWDNSVPETSAVLGGSGMQMIRRAAVAELVDSDTGHSTFSLPHPALL